jgi:hypothetical protein
MSIAKFVCIAAALFAQSCFAEEELITSAHYPDGEAIPYILNYQTKTPKYVVILFPGGDGKMNPRMVDGKLVYGFKGNFVIRARPLMVDDEFATVATNSTNREKRIQGLIDDIKTRFPNAKIYLMSTSNGTYASVDLADYLQDKIAGEIHTSSLSAQVYFHDFTKYKNRQVLVHHKQDDCRFTPFSAALHSHEKYGTELIAMEGGGSEGDVCEPFAHHGYYGIERETIEAIKNWIKQGG